MFPTLSIDSIGKFLTLLGITLVAYAASIKLPEFDDQDEITLKFELLSLRDSLKEFNKEAGEIIKMQNDTTLATGLVNAKVDSFLARRSKFQEPLTRTEMHSDLQQNRRDKFNLDYQKAAKSKSTFLFRGILITMLGLYFWIIFDERPRLQKHREMVLLSGLVYDECQSCLMRISSIG